MSRASSAVLVSLLCASLAVATIAITWQLATHVTVGLVAAILVGAIVGELAGHPPVQAGVLAFLGAVLSVVLNPLLRGTNGDFLAPPSLLVGAIAVLAVVASQKPPTPVLAGLLAMNLFPMSDTIPLRLWPPFLLQFVVLVLPGVRTVLKDERFPALIRRVLPVLEPMLLVIVTWLLVLPFVKVRTDGIPLLANYYISVFGLPASVAALPLCFRTMPSGGAR